jgi:F-type H+-transporting ATPase subunit delta
MSAKAIASRYALALLDEAVGQGVEDVVEKDLKTIKSIMESSKDLRMLFRSPIIEWWRKKNIAKEVFEIQISLLTMNFMMLVIQKGREKFLREMATEYHALLDLRRNILRINVDSAVAMDAVVQKSLTDGLSKKLGKSVEAEFETHAELIGGLRVTIGDTVYDGSIRTQLDELRERLATSV